MGSRYEDFDQWSDDGPKGEEPTRRRKLSGSGTRPPRRGQAGFGHLLQLLEGRDAGGTRPLAAVRLAQAQWAFKRPA